MQRFFQVLLVAAIVLVGLVLALTTGYGGNWYVSISLAIVGVAVLIFLALSKRTALILVATMVMFAQSLQFWFGE